MIYTSKRPRTVKKACYLSPDDYERWDKLHPNASFSNFVNECLVDYLDTIESVGDNKDLIDIIESKMTDFKNEIAQVIKKDSKKND